MPHMLGPFLVSESASAPSLISRYKGRCEGSVAGSGQGNRYTERDRFVAEQGTYSAVTYRT